jgi:hypothetical protein
MYKFVKETIVNNGGSGVFSAANGVLSAKKIMNLPVTSIVRAYKRGYKAPVKDKWSVKFGAVSSTETATDYRFVINLTQKGKYDAEFQNMLTYSGVKVSVEVAVTPSMTAASLAELVEDALNDYQTVKGWKYVTVTRSSDTITLEVTDEYNRIKSLELQAIGTSLTGYAAYTSVAFATGSITHVATGSEGFGTCHWVMKNLRLPTLANTSFGAPFSDERPVPGAQYSQYTFVQKSERPELGGTSAVNSEVTSKTTHVLYCDAASSAALEAACVSAGISIDTVGVDVSAVTLGNISLASAAGTGGAKITYTTTPSGVTGAIFARDTDGDIIDGTLDESKVSLTSDGVLSLATGHGIAANDKLGFAVTIDDKTFKVKATIKA